MLTPRTLRRGDDLERYRDFVRVVRAATGPGMWSPRCYLPQ